MFEITRLHTVDAAEQGAEMEIIHPVTGKGTGAFIRLAGCDSHIYQKAQNKVANRRLQSRARKVAAEDFEQEAMEVLKAVTLGWRGLAVNGEEWPFTPDNVEELYTKSPEVRQQAERFIGDRTNFIQD